MGLTSEEALGAALSYVKKTLAGMGALKGANCQIQSITYNPSTRTNTVVFLWKDNNDVSHTSQMEVHDGGQGQFISGYTVSGVAPYRRNWLEDEDGNVITPAENLFYVVMSEGDYYKTLLFFDETENVYVSIAAGGAGTEDYEQLVNLPQINGVELKGNKVPAQLGFGTVLTLPISNTITSKTGLISQLEYLLNTVTDFTQDIQIINHADIMDISEVFLPAGTIIKGAFYAEGSGNNQRFRGICFDINGNTHVLSFSYSISDNEISNFQLVNLVGLSEVSFTQAEKTKLASVEANAQENLIESITVNGVEVVPVNKAVALTMLTRAVNDLQNYYLKTETYTKEEVNTLINNISSISFAVVEELPEQDISTSTIYLVPITGQTNVYMQYMYIDDEWAQLGSTAIDLSNYYTKAQIDALLLLKQDALTFDSTPISLSDNPVTSGGIYNALALKQDALTFDNAPTNASSNPVTSGGVYTALQGKQDTLQYDTEPTIGSHNAVDSNAVAEALENVTVDVATTQRAGVVKPDGESITIDQDGTIHGASSNTFNSDDFEVVDKEVSLLPARRIFTGTQAEWDALTTAEKKTYGQVNITDDDEFNYSLFGQKYESENVVISETSWTTKTFTFNNAIPKGKYLIGAKFTPSAGNQAVHCVISDLAYVDFVTGYGSTISVATSEIHTKNIAGTASMSYSCAITNASNPVTVNLVLIRIG